MTGSHPGTSDSGSYRIALEIFSEADPSTAARGGDVELLVGKVCGRLGIAGEQRRQIELAGRLHDIGKIVLPRSVLDKPGPLDAAEWELVRGHTLAGERILSELPDLVAIATLVRHSHEHFDGSGYPDGLRGEQIPLGSRIILCADAFQAIRSDRPYRASRTAREALAEIEAHSGTQFDPTVVSALAACVDQDR